MIARRNKCVVCGRLVTIGNNICMTCDEIDKGLPWITATKTGRKWLLTQLRKSEIWKDKDVL